MSLPESFEARYVRPRPGRTLIVGSFVVPGKADRRALYPDAVGVDMRPGPGVDRVMDMEAPADDLGAFAHVECLSTLEHAQRPWLVAAAIERALQPGGTLYVEVPFNWWPHAYPDDYWRLTVSAVRLIFPSIDWAALLYRTHGGLTDRAKRIPHAKIDGHRYYARSMTCGFGTRRVAAA